MQPKKKLSREEQKLLSERWLIEAAMEIAAEEGVSAVTFDSIGRRAGYSRGLASQKFGSKEGLVRAVTDYLFEERSERPETIALENLSGYDALVAYNEDFFKGILADGRGKAYFKFFASAVADESSGRKVFKEYHDRFRDIFVSFLRRGIKDGTVRPIQNLNIAAQSYGCFLLGIALQAQADPDMSIKDVERETLQYIQARFAAE